MFIKNSASFIVWGGVGLTFAISISVDNGYNFGSTLLLLLTLLIFLTMRPKIRTLNKDDLVLIGVFLSYAVSILLSVYFDSLPYEKYQKSEISRVSRFFFILPVLLLLINIPNRKDLLWYGVILGAISAFSVALYQRTFLDYSRAHGFVNAIIFGDISMLFGFLSFAAGLYFHSQKKSLLLVFSLIGGGCGVAGSILSGSRGGWIALPLVSFFFFWETRHLLSPVLLKRMILVCVLIFSVGVLLPQTGVKARIWAAIDNINHYIDGENKVTSVGLRFENWKAAVYAFKQSPVFGVGGDEQFRKVKRFLAEDGVIVEDVVLFRHTHNELLDALAKRGIVGLIFLLILYFVPLCLFLRKMKEYKNDWEIRSYAMGGALIPMSYIDFGLTEVITSHSLGVLLYGLLIVAFWAAVRGFSKKEILR